MKPRAATSIILAGLTITGGRIAENKQPLYTDRMIVGGTFLVIGIAIMNAYNENFAGAFALLILVVAFLMYGVPLMAAIGFQVKEN